MKLHRCIIAVLVLALGVGAALASDTSPAPTEKPWVSGVVSKYDASTKSFRLTAGSQSYIVTWNNATKISGEGKDGQTAFVEYQVGVRPRGNPARIGAVSIRYGG